MPESYPPLVEPLPPPPTPPPPPADFEPQIRYLGDLQRLEVRPGDVFVLTCDDYLTVEDAERIRAHWNEFFDGPLKPKLIMLTKGMKLGVVSDPETVASRDGV